MIAKRLPGLLVFALATVSIGGCSDMCQNTLIGRVTAPDGKHSAVLFQRDCGATTGYSTQISILSGQEDLEGAGNSFRADDDHGRAAAGEWGGPWVDANWLSPEKLLVRYAKGSRVFEQKNSVSNASIEYQSIVH